MPPRRWCRGLTVPTEFRAIVNAHFRIEPPAGTAADPRRAQRHGRMAVRLSGPAVGDDQRRRPPASTRRARSWRRQIWSEVASVTGIAGRAAAVADRARAARDLRGDARRRRQASRRRDRAGAISCSPAIGPLPACRRPSKARSGPATAPPSFVATMSVMTTIPHDAAPTISIRSIDRRATRRAARAASSAGRPLGVRARGRRHHPGRICAAAALSRRAGRRRARSARSPSICAASRARTAAGRCSTTATST